MHKHLTSLKVDEISNARKLELLEFLRKQIHAGRVQFKRDSNIVRELQATTFERVPKRVLLLAYTAEQALKDKGPEFVYYVLGETSQGVYGACGAKK